MQEEIEQQAVVLELDRWVRGVRSDSPRLEKGSSLGKLVRCRNGDQKCERENGCEATLADGGAEAARPKQGYKPDDDCEGGGRAERQNATGEQVDVQNVRHGEQVGGQKVFIGENSPRGAMINYYLKAATTGDVKISIADATGRVIRTMDGTKKAGINRVLWNLAAGGQAGGGGGGGGGGRGGGAPAVDPGTYMVTLTAAGKTLTKPITILQDRWLSEK